MGLQIAHDIVARFNVVGLTLGISAKKFGVKVPPEQLDPSDSVAWVLPRMPTWIDKFNSVYIEPEIWGGFYRMTRGSLFAAKEAYFEEGDFKFNKLRYHLSIGCVVSIKTGQPSAYGQVPFPATTPHCTCYNFTLEGQCEHSGWLLHDEGKVPHKMQAASFYLISLHL